MSESGGGDENFAVVETRAAAGGSEAELWASDLYNVGLQVVTCRRPLIYRILFIFPEKKTFFLPSYSASVQRTICSADAAALLRAIWMAY